DLRALGRRQTIQDPPLRRANGLQTLARVLVLNALHVDEVSRSRRIDVGEPGHDVVGPCGDAATAGLHRSQPPRKIPARCANLAPEIAIGTFLRRADEAQVSSTSVRVHHAGKSSYAPDSA